MKKLLLSLLITTFCFAQSVGEDVDAFAFSLNAKLDGKQENLAFSPYGIFSNLALLYFGAQDETASQIQSTLHMSKTGNRFLNSFAKHLDGLTTSEEQGYTLNIANGLFPHQGTHFMQSFEEIATKNFKAKLQAVDFTVADSALETINNWVSDQTNGYIPQILEEGDIGDATRLVVANAVYFEGEWVQAFDPQKTTKEVFHPEFGPKLDTPTLHQTQYFPYFEDDKVQCLALPFIRKETMQPYLECLLVLPKNGHLSDLESTLTASQLNQWQYKLESTLVSAAIPKFSFSKRLNLNEPLKALGMKDAFTFQANFANIDGMKDLFLNDVIHETYFSFHENGVRAASATTSSIGLKSMPPEFASGTPFTADHPFLFFIVDYHSRAILFMGRVMKPEISSSDD